MATRLRSVPGVHSYEDFYDSLNSEELGGGHFRDEDVPEDIMYGHGDENHSPHFRDQRRSPVPPVHMAPSHAGHMKRMAPEMGAPNSVPYSDLADALAKRILAERDTAVTRLRDCEHELNRVAQAREHAENVASKAMWERDEAEDELAFVKGLLSDAALKNDALRSRVHQLELVVQKIILTAPEMAPQAPPPAQADSALGLAKTREAIEKAVKEAAALPGPERRKKLRALKLKWHPDKHEHLKEMAEEVTKMINQIVHELGADKDEDDQDNGREGNDK